MPQLSLSTVKLYILLVLLPQLIYFLTTRGYGLAAVCESCSPSTYIDIVYFRVHQDPPRTFFLESSSQSASAESADLPTVGAVCALDDYSDDITVVERVEESSKSISSKDVLADSEVLEREDLVSVTASSQMCFYASRELSARNLTSNKEVALQLSSKNARDGGWHIPHTLPELVGECNIKRRNTSLSQMDFLREFAFTEPVILSGVSDQSMFRAHSTKERLLLDYGSEVITVATANTHSYRKEKMTFCQYVERYMKPQTLDSLGNETLYHFGDNDRERWDPLFALYQLPPYQLPGKEPVLSFGLAGPGTGVPFHIHGPTFAETIFGRKRWFLYPPENEPQFHPDVTTLHWVTHTYPQLSQEDKPLECTLSPGEVIYFPDRWWHATLNLDSAVFMSTFYS